MPKYVIESELLGVGQLSAEEFRAAAQHSSSILNELGSKHIQWVQSFVTDDKIYSIYIASDKQMVAEHARQAGLAADRVAEVRAVIDPTTAEN